MRGTTNLHDLELRALKEDYTKLLIQCQAEMMEKNYLKKQCDMAYKLIQMRDEKIDRLELVLREGVKEL
tara:strand:+ start:143 stop:349 length:207 start_codon:yes stop_codon:yes gene_type:complete